jgi:alanine racemase
VGDEAVLLGHQGDASMSADDLAKGLDTINYEILCSPTARVSRVYLPG